MEYSLAIGKMTIHALKLPTNKHHVLAVKFDDEDCLYKVALFRTEADARWFMECLAEQLGWLDALEKKRNGTLVEVVRCKDCKYWAYEKDLDTSVCVMHSISGWRRVMPETAYCSMGVRKEGEE